MEKKESPLVSIKCLVYNHGQYLRQCLDGFIMQKTNFAFEAIVHDDASTDNSAEIIREYAEKYPDIIKPIYETENQYLKRDGSLGRIMNEAIHPDAKYIAICEGDDYWIDPLKLQKQVDYMENNPHCSLVHTGFKFYYQNENKFLTFKQKCSNYDTLTLEDKVLGGYIQTCTVLYKVCDMVKIRENNDFLFSGYFLMGDFQTWYELLKIGYIHYLPDETSVYRKNDGSATRPESASKYYRFRLSSAEARYYVSIRDKLSVKTQQICERNIRKAMIKYMAFDYQFKSETGYKIKLNWYEKFILKSRILCHYLTIRLVVQKKLGILYRKYRSTY